MTKDEIAAFCVDQLVDILRVPKESVDVNMKFTRLGLDSAMTIYLVMELEDKLSLELDHEVLADYPTIAELSAYLSQKTKSGAASDRVS
jgi:acyl carrier protein